MSRIEEALRRAGHAIVIDDDPSPHRSDHLRRGRGTELEQYPVESPSVQRVVPLQPETQRAARPERPSRTDLPRSAPLDTRAGRKLVIASDTTPESVEQYRRLAGTLYQAQVENGLKSIMVCSAAPREGKTLTAANLALTLSESYGQSVLLVDTDLRGASTHNLFGLPLSPGLGDFLQSDSLPLPTTSVSPTLSIVTAGTGSGNPIAGLVSDRMKHLVEQAATKFDWVVLDTPPVGLLPDASLLARLTDAVVFVVAAGATPFPFVQRAIAAIGAERVIGIVLNRASADAMPSSTYYQHSSGQHTASPSE